jgi:SAM-dependent methyltransferase
VYSQDVSATLDRDLLFHEELYSGFAQRHFGLPAVRAFREHNVAHILKRTGAGASARILSIGCGIGDTELLLAAYAGAVVGVDQSPAGIRQARADAVSCGIRNVCFHEGTLETIKLAPASFDVVVAIFLLHHLPDALLADIPRSIWNLLAPGGKFYAVDPSRERISGRIGRIVIPHLMKRHQTPDERELDGAHVTALFRQQGFVCQPGFYDFFSTPLAGLFPKWRGGYRLARRLDDALIRLPGVRAGASNFELLAEKPTVNR